MLFEAILFLLPWAPKAKAPCTVVRLADVFYVDRMYCHPARSFASFVSCDYGNPEAGRQIEKMILERIAARRPSTERARPDSDCVDGQTGVADWCGQPYISGKIVSIPCMSNWESLHPEWEPWAINVEIDGGSVREFSRDDLFPDDKAEEAFWDLAREQAAAALGDRYTESHEWFETRLDDIDNLARAIAFTADGVEIGFTREAFGPAFPHITVPYTSLHGILAARFPQELAPADR